MKSILKKYLPRDRLVMSRSIYDRTKMFVFQAVAYIRPLVPYLYVLRKRYEGEQYAVLKGNIRYIQRRRTAVKTCPALRRNIHRLEKGLIMRPRRAVFGEGFISETITILGDSDVRDHIDVDERQWAIDVLDKYFSVVKETEIVSHAKTHFASVKNDIVGFQTTRRERAFGRKSLPYNYNELEKSTIDYSSLRSLFLRRRSVRWFKDKPIDNTLVQQLVEMAALAPSACNRQPFRFIYVSDKKLVSKVAKCAGGTIGFSDNIPAIYVVVGDQSSFSHEGDRHVIYIDSSLAAMQLMLAAVPLGLATCPINWPDNDAAESEIRKLIEIEDCERIVMLIALGYPDSDCGIAYSQKKNSDVIMTEVTNVN